MSGHLCSAGSLMNKGLKLGATAGDDGDIGSAGSLMNKGLKLSLYFSLGSRDSFSRLPDE